MGVVLVITTVNVRPCVKPCVVATRVLAIAAQAMRETAAALPEAVVAAMSLAGLPAVIAPTTVGCDTAAAAPMPTAPEAVSATMSPAGLPAVIAPLETLHEPAAAALPVATPVALTGPSAAIAPSRAHCETAGLSVALSDGHVSKSAADGTDLSRLATAMGIDIGALLQRLRAEEPPAAALTSTGLELQPAAAMTSTGVELQPAASMISTGAALWPAAALHAQQAGAPCTPPVLDGTLALAGNVNSNSHPREYKLFQRACANSQGELASAWGAGGARRMRTFLNFVQVGCNSDATEAMMGSEATKSKEVRWEGEYLSEESILKALHYDNAKAQAFMARKRTEEDGVVIDPNDGTTEKFLGASSQKSTATTAQKETMAVRATAEPNAAFIGMMTGMTSSRPNAGAQEGQVRAFASPAASHGGVATDAPETAPKKSPPAKKAKVMKEAALSVEEALVKDPRAFAASWSNGLMNDIGKGEVTAMKLGSMDCQEELRGKLVASAGASCLVAARTESQLLLIRRNQFVGEPATLRAIRTNPAKRSRAALLGNTILRLTLKSRSFACKVIVAFAFVASGWALRCNASETFWVWFNSWANSPTPCSSNRCWITKGDRRSTPTKNGRTLRAESSRSLRRRAGGWHMHARGDCHGASSQQL